MRLKAIIGQSRQRWRGLQPDQRLRFELVRALYGVTSTPKAMVGATFAALAATGTAGVLSGDRAYGIFLVGFLLIGVGRGLASRLYHRIRHDPLDTAATRHWELVALAGAWAFAGLVGFTGAYALMYQHGTDIETLISCCVMGYLAGASSRNASRPLITIGQLSFTCIPFIFALLSRGDFVHVMLAVVVTVLYVGAVVVCRTVFENFVLRHQAFQRNEKLARRDPLTGTWNRAAFLDLLTRQFGPTEPTKNQIGLIAVDLDRFKDINDTFGHPVGDAVLREAVDRIQSVLCTVDQLSRVGGDEFLIMLTEGRAHEVEDVARSILERLREPFAFESIRSVCGASLGCAIAPRDGASVDELLRNADLALYEAKARGRGQVVCYSVAFSTQYHQRIALEHDLESALARKELELEYQPIVDHRSGRTLCCEALLRWRRDSGRISPAAFIPVMESTGLIVPIGAWVLTSACREAVRWDPAVKVTVNLSAVQFRRGRDIVNTVNSALLQSGLPARRLELEITESVLIDDSTSALAILEELRSMGIGIALDDFGTGFASLSYLSDYPFSKIKIDRKFCQNADQSWRTAAILRSITQISRELRLECVAEGVETLAQLDQMQHFGIEAVQGYVFSRPLVAPLLRQLIERPIFPAGLRERHRSVTAEPLDLLRRVAS
jgi:diguanylate cyclase (GGDEF)-like protein